VSEDTEAPKGGEFNPSGQFYIIFDLTFHEMETDDEIALLSMVWNAPFSPQPGDTIHIGVMNHDFVIRIRGYKNPRKFSGVSWNEDGSLTLNATLFNIKSPRDFLDRIEGLVEAQPSYRERLRAGLHIIPGAEMLAAEEEARQA
jgi:hypothetical protein